MQRAKAVGREQAVVVCGVEQHLQQLEDLWYIFLNSIGTAGEHSVSCH